MKSDAEHIRDTIESFTASGQDASPEAIMESLRKRGVSVPAELVTMVLNRMRISPSPRGESDVREPVLQPSPRSGAASGPAGSRAAGGAHRERPTTTAANQPGDERKIRDLLASAQPEAMVLALQLLESIADSPAIWQAAIDRHMAYSICLLAEQAEESLVDRFVAALNDGFSQKTTEGLSAACQHALQQVDTTRKTSDYKRLRLCGQLSPIGLEALEPDDSALPAIPPDDAPFAAAAIGRTLGQILWRDLALEGRLELHYQSDSYLGDRLMPVDPWRLIDEKKVARDSFGCAFICSHGASYSLPWIEKHRSIDPAEIRGHIYSLTYYDSDHQETLEPRFTEEGLVFMALEGLCDNHLLLRDEPAFDRRIAEVFADDGEVEAVTVKVLDVPVVENAPKACFRELSDRQKTWIADLLVAAAADTFCRESAALSKHVLGWMTIHPATPEALRERLAGIGFGVTAGWITDRVATKPKPAVVTEPPAELEVPAAKPVDETGKPVVTAPVPLPEAGGKAAPPEPDKGEKPDRARTARLRKIVKAWEKICEADGVCDLSTREFIAAHYAKLVLADDVILTKAGWAFLDETESSILDAADDEDAEDAEDDEDDEDE